MTEQLEKVEDILELEGLALRKKKKKKKQFNMEDLEKALNDPGDATGPGDAAEADKGDTGEVGGEEKPADDIGDDLNFDFAKKKKKKKKIITFDEDADKPNDENVDLGTADGVDADGIGFGDSEGMTSEGSNWLGTDRDYTYDELIEHVFNIIRANNPELNAGERKRFVMKPPTVLRVGTKKTSFANFLEICKLVHRQPKHMQAFLLAELGTSGSVDANNQLIIKGRFLQKQIENVLRRYIKEYVACQTCRSPNTILQKETRLFFLQCEKCGSRRSVSSIKSGFQAVTSKRAAIRAKTN